MLKANMMIIRGRSSKLPWQVDRDWSPLKLREMTTEYAGESWSLLELRAYMGLPPKRQDERSTSYFDLVLLVPGRAPIKCEVCFYRGCSALAIPSDVVDLVPPEFADVLEAMHYADKNGLEVPPILPEIFKRP